MYENLSLIYDQFMKDVDYNQWADYLYKLINDNKIYPNEIIEYGCGTGNLTLALIRNETNIIGVDNSSEMLSLADQKTEINKGVKYFNGDMTLFSYGKPVDAIICACDTINHLKENKLDSFFKKIYSELNKNGIFLFDMVTESYLKNYVATRPFVFESDDIFFIWESELNKDFIEYYFTFFIKEGEFYRRIDDSQKEYFLNSKEVKKKLLANGFSNVLEYEFLTKNFPDNQTDRIQFVAIK